MIILTLIDLTVNQFLISLLYMLDEIKCYHIHEKRFNIAFLKGLIQKKNRKSCFKIIK